MKLDHRHFALKLIDGAYYGLREQEASDLSLKHMDPPPKNLAKTTQHQGRFVSADRLTVPLTIPDAEAFELTSNEAFGINRIINSCKA